MTVRSYSAWETTATLRLLGHPRGRRGAGHIVSPRAQLVILAGFIRVVMHLFWKCLCGGLGLGWQCLVVNITDSGV